MHLQIRKVLLNQQNIVSGEVFNIFMSDFGQLSYIVKCKLFNQYCSSFYGSPLWSLKSIIVESMCVDWRKTLRSLWRVDSRTHCDLITAVSNQIPLI